MAGDDGVVQRRDDAPRSALGLFQIALDEANEAGGQLLGILPLHRHVQLRLFQVPQQLLQRGQLGSQERQVDVRGGDEGQVHGHKLQLVSLGGGRGQEQGLRGDVGVRRVADHDAGPRDVGAWALEAPNDKGVVYAEVKAAVVGANDHDVDSVMVSLVGLWEEELDAGAQGEDGGVLAERALSARGLAAQGGRGDMGIL